MNTFLYACGLGWFLKITGISTLGMGLILVLVAMGRAGLAPEGWNEAIRNAPRIVKLVDSMRFILMYVVMTAILILWRWEDDKRWYSVFCIANHIHEPEGIMFLLMGLCFSMAAFGLLGGAVWAFISQQRKMDERVQTTGTVVDLVYSTTASARSNIICPVVEFTATSGEKVRFTSDFGSRPASHKVGQTVNVRYDPVDPHQAEIDSTMNRWLVPVILVFMGSIGCCLGIVFLAVYGLGSASFTP